MAVPGITVQQHVFPRTSVSSREIGGHLASRGNEVLGVGIRRMYVNGGYTLGALRGGAMYIHTN